MADPHVMVIQLARNFGHQAAISAGLDYSRGHLVCVMDADLQDPPEVLPQLISKSHEGYDVVYAIREHRKENWLKRCAYAAFYRVLQGIADISIPLDSGDFCVMNRRIVNLLVSMPERNRFLRGIRRWVGFRQIGIAYTRPSRFAGKSKYTVSSLIFLALDGLISFSYVPLRVISILGITVSLLSVAVAAFYFIKKLTYGIGVPGFTTLVVAIFFLAGMQLITIGVIGEYVGRISDEVKRRPLYIVRQVTRRHSPSVF
jgi:dolichol-phosphate mannosyltransferase